MLTVHSVDRDGAVIEGERIVRLTWEELERLATQNDATARRAYAWVWILALTKRAQAALDIALRTPVTTSCMGWSYRNSRYEPAVRESRECVHRTREALRTWEDRERRIIADQHVVADRVMSGDLDSAARVKQASTTESRHAAAVLSWTREAWERVFAMERLVPRLD